MVSNEIEYICFQNERGHVSKPQPKEFSYVHKPTLAHSNDICHLFYIYLYFFSWELKFATKLHFNSIMGTKNENIRCMTNPCKVLGQLCQSRGCPPDPNSMHVWYSPTFPFGEAQIHLKWKHFSHLEKMQPCWHRGARAIFTNFQFALGPLIPLYKLFSLIFPNLISQIASIALFEGP